MNVLEPAGGFRFDSVQHGSTRFGRSGPVLFEQVRPVRFGWIRFNSVHPVQSDSIRSELGLRVGPTGVSTPWALLEPLGRPLSARIWHRWWIQLQAGRLLRRLAVALFLPTYLGPWRLPAVSRLLGWCGGAEPVESEHRAETRVSNTCFQTQFKTRNRSGGKDSISKSKLPRLHMRRDFLLSARLSARAHATARACSRFVARRSGSGPHDERGAAPRPAGTEVEAR